MTLQIIFGTGEEIFAVENDFLGSHKWIYVEVTGLISRKLQFFWLQCLQLPQIMTFLRRDTKWVAHSLVHKCM